MVLDNWHAGRKKHVWVSISADLIEDAGRDLGDLGVQRMIPVMPLMKQPYARIALGEGVMFSTYATLISGSRGAGGRQRVSRLDQLVEWCGGPDFDGLLVFDEARSVPSLLLFKLQLDSRSSPF